MSISATTWLVDMGNSRLKLAPLMPTGEPGPVIVIGNDQADRDDALVRALGAHKPADRGDVLSQALSTHHAAGALSLVWLASVAPEGVTLATVLLLQAAGAEVRRVRTRLECGRLKIAYADPAALGVDRFLSLLAASEREDGPWVMVSAGSALTVDVLAREGTHQGGLIAGMPGDMQAALARRFSQLDVPAGRVRALADNTADAIASGSSAAILGLVERTLRLAGRQLGDTPTLLLSGGAAELLADIEHSKIVHAPTLPLEGLALFARGEVR